MVNQIIVDSKQNNKVILANSVDSGSNEFIIRWLCDLHRIPRIIIGGETYIPTSEDYMLKIPATMWTGNSYFLVTIRDTMATTELKIYRIADTEGNISMRIMGDNTYRLMKVTSGEVGEYDSFLSLTSVNAVQNKVITQALTEQATNIEELSQEIQEIIGSENNVYYGEETPANTLGNNKDWYLQTYPQHILLADGYDAKSNTQHPIYADNFSETENGYNFNIHGNPSNNGNGEQLWYFLNGLQIGNTYHVSFDLQFVAPAYFTELGEKNSLTIENAFIEFRYNTSNNHYEADFTYSGNNKALFKFELLMDDYNFTAQITNFTITGQIEFQSGYIELYNKHNNEWLKYYGSGGGSAVQSDWTQADPNADDYIKNKPTLGTASAKDYTTSVTENDADLVTSGAVYSAISNLPKAMIFQGTLGNNGTIQILPSASAQNEGYTYKVITAGTYASQSAKVGDAFTSNGSEWVLIPSGDETDTDTWRNINVNGSEVLGNGISSGGLDFINGTGLNAVFNSTGNKLQFNVDTDNLAPAFTEASTRANISTGEALSTLFGKIKKFFSDLKTVAFSGSYNDLTDKPTIPSAQVNSDWNATSGIAEILNKPTLATVATSGNYNDLSNKPTIPTVNNGTLTIQKNGTDVQTFTANQSTNATANIIVPTKTSDLINDSSYITDNPTFTEATTRTNIASGESFATILGKIKKFFTDLKTVAFSGSYNDLTDKPTIPSPYTLPTASTTTKGGIKIGSNLSMNGEVLNATDTTYSNATQSASGLMSATDKTKLDGIASGAQVNSITGVKGDKESNYRTGNVNLTPSNIGATIFLGNLTSLGSDTPASATKTYFTDNIPNNSVCIAYNSLGTEYTIIFSRGGNANYGTILKYTYGSRYMYILRMQGGAWQSTDWEEIYCGYARTAGSADTATKLGSSNVGSALQPMYLNGGTPTACTFTLGKSVPSNAVFTDTTTGTTYTAGNVPDNTTFATNGSVKNAYDALNSKFATSSSKTEINITSYNSSSNQYTCPSNGFVYINASLAQQQWADVTLYINNMAIWSINAGGYSTPFSSSITFRVNSGDKIYHTASAATVNAMSFKAI